MNPPTINVPPSPAAAPAMGRAVGGGMSWMLVATIIAKLATSISQLLLGWWLLPEHFARFAIATTVAGLLMLAKDGGIPNFLVRRGPDEYARLSGPSFWLCLTYNLAAASIMAIAAWPVATLIFDDVKIAPMLWVMAASLPLGTPASVLQTKLRIDLRFRDFSLLLAFSAIMRQVLTILLAKLHFEEMSLAGPVVLTAIIDSILAAYVCGDTPWKRPAILRKWGELLNSTKWLINGTVATFMTEWGPYLALGKLLSKDNTGYYFFAYQITAQIGTLLSFNLHVVLMPVLARMNDQPERQRAAFLRVLRGLTLVGSFLSLAVSVVISPLEHLLWHGKWAPAVPVVIVFGIFYPWRVSYAVTCAALMAQGRFKRFSMSAWFEGLALTGVVGLVCWWRPELLTVAIATGLTLVFTRLVVTAHVCRMFGVSMAAMAAAMLGGWLLSVAAAAPALYFDRMFDWKSCIHDHLPADLYRSLGTGVVDVARSEVVRASIVDVIRCIIAGTMFCGVFFIFARLLMSNDMREALNLLPARLRSPAGRLLGLPRE